MFVQVLYCELKCMFTGQGLNWRTTNSVRLNGTRPDMEADLLLWRFAAATAVWRQYVIVTLHFIITDYSTRKYSTAVTMKLRDPYKSLRYCIEDMESDYIRSKRVSTASTFSVAFGRTKNALHSRGFFVIYRPWSWVLWGLSASFQSLHENSRMVS